MSSVHYLPVGGSATDPSTGTAQLGHLAGDQRIKPESSDADRRHSTFGIGAMRLLQPLVVLPPPKSRYDWPDGYSNTH
jgi:hypothetical protein